LLQLAFISDMLFTINMMHFVVHKYYR